MTRQIKGYKFLERARDTFEEYKSIKLYTGLYGKENIKVLRMQNQYGQPYTDIYVKQNVKPKRKLVSQFGSVMTFEDKQGRQYGDIIRIKK